MQCKEKSVRYTLITAARNEESHIEKTIQSVIGQTVLPEKWVIVSDGSTDRTDEIVKRYEKNYDFIRLVRRDNNTNRNFASKVFALRAGFETLNGTEYNFIGNLDADITFGADYYEKLLDKFRENPRLGIAGGIVCELRGKKWINQRTNVEWSVAGGVQTFRRQCYDTIGGYLPLPKGGEDAIAEVMARKHGWEVRTFPQLEALHHREGGTASEGFYAARISLGVHHYSLGYMLWFEVARCFSRMKRSYVIAELLTLWGYILAILRRDKIAVPEEIRDLLRREQIDRLKNALRIRRLKPGK